jgi:haloacetate dehalogenase
MDSPFFPGFRSGRTTIDGVGFHFVVGGEGPPLLLLHGAPQSHIMWRRMAPVLAERFTLVIPDLKGYGRSDKPERGSPNADYTKRRSAADMAALMTELGFERFRAAGHDRGARVTRRLCKDHPQRVEEAAILDIVPTSWAYSHITKEMMTSMWPWSLWASPYPSAETVLKPDAVVAMSLRATNPDDDATKDYLETNGNLACLHAMCEDYRAGASVDLEHDAADQDRLIDTRLLVLWGKNSPSTGKLFDVEAAWRKEAKNLTFACIESGHFMPEEAPETTAAEMLPFFSA